MNAFPSVFALVLALITLALALLDLSDALLLSASLDLDDDAHDPWEALREEDSNV